MVAGVITIAAALLGILLPTIILPLLPDFRPLTLQLLIRLREVAAFLAFTTAIAIGILSTQRKNADHDNHKNLLLEHHSLGSIFGESGYEERDPVYADNGKHLFSPLAKKKQQSKDLVHSDGGEYLKDLRFSSARDDGVSPPSIRSCETVMEASHTERSWATAEEESVGKHNVQRRLHRKSSSLDDSVNYVPENEDPLSSGITEHVRASNNEYGVLASKKSTKRVSFSIASSPLSSPKHVGTDQNIRQLKRDQTRDVSATSPGDLTGQADAFIAKFKEQLRMQNLEEIPKYQRRL
ncbi:hypothetical protein GOP47_0008290 [Adiantum capillus-veneris]|nr:hypothetical protein GOP47_0008290 [Adiantum capillus-veneris]